MRSKWVKNIKFMILILLLLSTLADKCDDGTVITETPTDNCPSWDTDCDGISNAVETNDANSYLGLNPDSADANPSIAHGYPWNGWIGNALNMVNQGTGYYHYNPDKSTIDTDDWGVLHLINMIEGAGRLWYTNGYPPPRIGVGDLSWGDQYTQQFGGPWPGDEHTWHQNGTEVDFRYVRNDGQEASLNVRTQPSLYDTNATVALMNYLFANSHSIYIMVSPHCGIEFSGITVVYDQSGEHDNHFHLRIEDPDGTGN
jgi:hypothetical protein